MIPDVVVDALAVYRLTRLAVRDALTQDWRDGIIRAAYKRDGQDFLTALADHGLHWDVPGDAQQLVEIDQAPPKLAELVTCRWCAGVWVAAGVVAARALAPEAWRPVAKLLALSCAAPLIARLEDD